MALHLTSCDANAAERVRDAAPDMLAALREARRYLGADLDSLLRSFCAIGRNGKPRLETLASEGALAVVEARDLFDRIGDAITKATGAQP